MFQFLQPKEAWRDKGFLPRQEVASLDNLNLSQGFAGSCLEDIVQAADRQGVRDKIQEKKKEGETALERLSVTKKVTAGIIFKCNRGRLNGDVHVVVQDHKNKKKEVDEKKKEDKRREWRKKREKVTQVRQETAGKDPKHWTVSQLKTMVAYKKTKEDPAIPTTKARLLDRWLLTSVRPTPPSTPVSSDNEGDDGSEEDGPTSFSLLLNEEDPPRIDTATSTVEEGALTSVPTPSPVAAAGALPVGQSTQV